MTLSFYLTLRSLLTIHATPTVRVKCSQDDTVGDFKKLLAAQTGTDPSKIILKKWYVRQVIVRLRFSHAAHFAKVQRSERSHYIGGLRGPRRDELGVVLRRTTLSASREIRTGSMYSTLSHSIRRMI